MLKRLIWIFIGASPFLLLGVIMQSKFFPLTDSYAWLGFVLLFSGVFIAFLNFYLSFLRIPLHRLLHPDFPDPKFTSGAPMVGAMALLGLLFLNKSVILILIVFVSLLADTGGIQWFVVAVWNDKSFWRKEVEQ